MNDAVREAVREYLIFEAATSKSYPFKKYPGEITDDEMEQIVKACKHRDDTETVHYAIGGVVGWAEDPKLTRDDLKIALAAGKTMNELFPFRLGQDCEIFKASRFAPGSEIIYIPDAGLNEIPMDRPITDAEKIKEVVSQCYTWYDFIDLCGGDSELAERLFDYCDWQHPGSALPEVDYEEEG